MARNEGGRLHVTLTKEERRKIDVAAKQFRIPTATFVRIVSLDAASDPDYRLPRSTDSADEA